MKAPNVIMEEPFVDKIARQYLAVYEKLGYQAAKDYAARVVGEDKEVQEVIRNKVTELIGLQAMPGGPPSAS